MKHIILNYLSIIIISTVIFFTLTLNASLDNDYIINLLIILVLQTSLILAVLLKKREK